MDANEVKAKVIQDLDGQTVNKFGCSIEAHLVDPPSLENLKDTNGNLWPMWVIYREPDGYIAAFDPDNMDYNLCINGTTASTYTCLRTLFDSL
jgi:hypothetical protein